MNSKQTIEGQKFSYLKKWNLENLFFFQSHLIWFLSNIFDFIFNYLVPAA